MLLQLFIISVSLALDAMSVSIAGGLEIKRAKAKYAFRVALFFGGFQAIMPLVGWFIGQSVTAYVTKFAPWIAFLLLVSIGILMVREAVNGEKIEKRSILSTQTLLLLSVATSIDALIVGISLGLIHIPLLLSVSVIGIITFILSFVGFIFGSELNALFRGKLAALGGLALIVLGLKMLISVFL